jgi:hypothetical protein
MCVINFNALASVERIRDNKMVPQKVEKRQPENDDVYEVKAVANAFSAVMLGMCPHVRESKMRPK